MRMLPLAGSLRSLTLATLLFAALSFVVIQFAHTQTPQPRGAVSQTCSGTFAGSWRLPNDAGASWAIEVTGSRAHGSYRVPGRLRRILSGPMTTSSVWRGTWYEESIDRALSGTFVAFLSAPERRIRVNFSANNMNVDSADWFCAAAGTPSPRPTPSSTTATPTPTPTPVPTPSAISIRADHDTDNFQLFDSLEPAEQQKVLILRGPRLPIEYSADDLSMRVLVKSGWPMALDYGLTRADYADLTIEIPGVKPDRIRLEPSERRQISRNLPEWRGRDIRVAKIRVKASSPDGAFRVYGFGMGNHAASALKRPADISRSLLAMNKAEQSIATNFPDLFLPTQIGTSIEIRVSLPTSLRLGLRPRQRIEFSCLSQSDFSAGRWEWWRVVGTNWEKVWQKGTGSISRNQPKSQTWDGIITSARTDSVGYHSLSISVWQRADEPEWVAARTDPGLEVLR